MIVAALVELELKGDRLEEMRCASEVGADLEEQAVGPGIDAAIAEVGDSSLGIGREGAGSERDANASRRLTRANIENVRRDGGQAAHSPTKSSGLTGARRSSRPGALRKAATTAAGTTTVDGSPTPLAP